MNVKYIITIWLLSFSSVLAQKKPLDHSVYDEWQSLGNKAISKNGQWISYSIDPQVGDNELILENPENSKKIIIPRGSKATFTEGSDFLICIIKPPVNLTQVAIEDGSDTLAVVNLTTSEVWKRGGVQSFYLSSDADNWITFRTAINPENLSIKRLDSNEVYKYDNTTSFKFTNEGAKLLLLQKANEKSFISEMDFSRMALDTLFSETGKIRNFNLSKNQSKLAYTFGENNSLQIKQYDFNLEKVEIVLRNEDLADSLQLNPLRVPYYSNNGERLYFGVKKRKKYNTNNTDRNQTSVEIWRYNDTNYHPSQVKSKQYGSDWDFLSVYNFSSSTHFILEDGIIKVQPIKSDDILLAQSNFWITPASQWGSAYNREFDLYSINTNNGNLSVVEKAIQACSGVNVMQILDKYFVWYDCMKKNYFAWNGEHIQNITEKIPTQLYDVNWDMPGNPLPYGIMGWVAVDSTVLIYDQFDIWKVDVKGKKPPVNLTGGTGRKQNTEIRHAFNRPGVIDVEIDSNRSILLKTFNYTDRSSGLGILTPDLQEYVRLKLPSPGFYIDFVSQANDKIIYTKENYQNSPDFYFANINPKDYTVKERKITSINPQQSTYDWGTSELYHWTTFNGHKAEGILYKPENFDPNKKYPLICHYYEDLGMATEFNKYVAPSPSRGSVNISYFVSQGYVVFVPGISFTLGETCASTFDFVVSGTESLIKEGFVDGNNMGIQGSSFGGYETFCLITQTNLFKAAWASVPVGNLITHYGLTIGEGGTNHGKIENGQYRINSMLWDDVNRYIENSPYFHLKNVTTPTVIVSNDKDPATRLENGIEMFLGMRRLGKEVWLLNYRGEGHAVINRENQLDLQKRMSEYFNYFLRNSPPPFWLTNDVHN